MTALLRSDDLANPVACPERLESLVRSSEVVLKRVFTDHPVGQLTFEVELDHICAHDDISQKDLSVLDGRLRHPAADAHHQPQPNMGKTGTKTGGHASTTL